MAHNPLAHDNDEDVPPPLMHRVEAALRGNDVLWIPNAEHEETAVRRHHRRVVPPTTRGPLDNADHYDSVQSHHTRRVVGVVSPPAEYPHQEEGGGEGSAQRARRGNGIHGAGNAFTTIGNLSQQQQHQRIHSHTYLPNATHRGSPDEDELLAGGGATLTTGTVSTSFSLHDGEGGSSGSGSVTLWRRIFSCCRCCHRDRSLLAALVEIVRGAVDAAQRRLHALVARIVAIFVFTTDGLEEAYAAQHYNRELYTAALVIAVTLTLALAGVVVAIFYGSFVGLENAIWEAKLGVTLAFAFHLALSPFLIRGRWLRRVISANEKASDTTSTGTHPGSRPTKAWALPWVSLTPLEIAAVASTLGMFCFLFAMAASKGPASCDSVADRTICSKTIRNDGTISIVFLSVSMGYRVRAAVGIPLLTIMSLVYLLFFTLALHDPTTQLKKVTVMLVCCLYAVTCGALFLADRVSRRHYQSKLRLAAEQRSAAALHQMSTFIAGSMIPEHVAISMARGDVARYQLPRDNNNHDTIVLCIGLVARATDIIMKLGPAGLVLSSQRTAVIVDSAAEDVRTYLKRRHLKEKRGDEQHVVVTKYHALGDGMELSFHINERHSSEEGSIVRRHVRVPVRRSGANATDAGDHEATVHDAHATEEPQDGAEGSSSRSRGPSSATAEALLLFVTCLESKLRVLEHAAKAEWWKDCRAQAARALFSGFVDVSPLADDIVGGEGHADHHRRGSFQQHGAAATSARPTATAPFVFSERLVGGVGVGGATATTFPNVRNFVLCGDACVAARVAVRKARRMVELGETVTAHSDVSGLMYLAGTCTALHKATNTRAMLDVEEDHIGPAEVVTVVTTHRSTHNALPNTGATGHSESDGSPLIPGSSPSYTTDGRSGQISPTSSQGSPCSPMPPPYVQQREFPSLVAQRLRIHQPTEDYPTPITETVGTSLQGIHDDADVVKGVEGAQQPTSPNTNDTGDVVAVRVIVLPGVMQVTLNSSNVNDDVTLSNPPAARRATQLSRPVTVMSPLPSVLPMATNATARAQQQGPSHQSESTTASTSDQGGSGSKQNTGATTTATSLNPLIRPSPSLRPAPSTSFAMASRRTSDPRTNSSAVLKGAAGGARATASADSTNAVMGDPSIQANSLLSTEHPRDDDTKKHDVGETILVVGSTTEVLCPPKFSWLPEWVPLKQFSDARQEQSYHATIRTAGGGGGSPCVTFAAEVGLGVTFLASFAVDRGSDGNFLLVPICLAGAATFFAVVGFVVAFEAVTFSPSTPLPPFGAKAKNNGENQHSVVPVTNGDAVSPPATPPPRPPSQYSMHLFSALDALFLGGIVALYIITPGDGTSVIGSDSFMWVATMFLISGLRDRSVYVLVSSLSEILVAAAFLVAMNVRSSSRSLAGIEEVVAICSCICCLAFRWSSDASRRHFFANDEELRRVEKISTQENLQLTELLFQMIPVTKETTKGQMFGRLLELVRAGEEDRHLKSRKQIDEGPAPVANDEEQFSWQLFGQCSNLRSATLSSIEVEEERRHQRSAQAVRDVLLTAPRHFGLRGSVFATRVMDKPFLVIRVHSDTTPHARALSTTAADTSTTSSGGTTTSHQTRTQLSHRKSSSTTSEGGVPPHYWLQATDECMRRITDAVKEVPHAALVKTNGDVVVVAVETTGASIDRECVLLMAVAAALARKKKAVPASHPNDSSSPKLKRNTFVLSEEQSTLLLATSMRCLLTAGPAVGGVLGTAALTFEYFGEPLETSQRLLSAHQNDLFLWPRTAAPLADAIDDTPCSFTDTDRDDVAVHIVATQRFSKWFLTGLDAPPTLPTASNTLSAIVFPKVVARLKIGDSIEAAGAPRYFLQAAMDLEQRGFLASLSVVTQTFIMMSAPPTHVEDKKKSSGLKSPPHQQPSTTDGNQDAIILHTQRYSIVVGCVFSHSFGSEVGDNATVHAAMKGPTKRHHRAPLSSVSLHRIFIRDDEVQYPQ